MSLQQAEALLSQYNKRNPINITATSVDSHADRFFRQAYLNQYDAARAKYGGDRNFSSALWQEAFKRGELDTYLGFLENVGDKQLYDEYYDPLYYDYETMMLGLYAEMADDTVASKRTSLSIDPTTGKEVEVDIGEMTDKGYYKYQIQQMLEERRAELDRQIEEQRKASMSGFVRTMKSLHAIGLEFGEGILVGLAGFADFINAPFYALGAAGQGENFLDAFVEYYGSVGLTAQEKAYVRSALDEYERTNTWLKNIDGSATTAGLYLGGMANSIGMMVPSIVLNSVTGVGWLSTAVFYTSIFAGNMYENANDPGRIDSPSWLKIANATIKTGAEVAVEIYLGKVLDFVGIGGSTLQNRLIGIGGGKVEAEALKVTTGRAVGKMFKDAFQEGLEEVLQDFSNELIDQFTAIWQEGYGDTGFTAQSLVDSFAIGALCSLVLTGAAVGKDYATTAVQNKRLLKETGKPGQADMWITNEQGKPERIRGLKKLYLSQMLGEFKDNVDSLAKAKIVNGRTLEQAKGIYNTYNALSQMFTTLGPERSAKALQLFSRAVNAQEQKLSKPVGISGTEMALALGDISLSLMTKTEKQRRITAVHDFANTIAKDIDDMISLSKLKGGEKILRQIRDDAEKATALREGEVTKVTAVANGDGVTEKRELDPDVQKVADALTKKGRENLDALRNNYDWVFVTDGHTAVEKDGVVSYLFVSQAWLNNYDTNRIFHFLEQTRVIETITKDKTFAPMIKKLVAFEKDFNTDLKGEYPTEARAIMDFLFNESIYQGFLLSNNGENLLAFSKFVFNIHDLIKELAKTSNYYNQKFRGKIAQARVNMLNQVYDKIKETMRRPTIKAIVNWGFDPQQLGADSLLSQGDLNFINQRAHAQGRLYGTNGSRYGDDFNTIVNHIGKYKEGVFDGYTLDELKTLADEPTQIEAIRHRMRPVLSKIYGPRFETHDYNIYHNGARIVRRSFISPETRDGKVVLYIRTSDDIDTVRNNFRSDEKFEASTIPDYNVNEGHKLYRLLIPQDQYTDGDLRRKRALQAFAETLIPDYQELADFVEYLSELSFEEQTSLFNKIGESDVFYNELDLGDMPKSVYDTLSGILFDDTFSSILFDDLDTRSFLGKSVEDVMTSMSMIRVENYADVQFEEVDANEIARIEKDGRKQSALIEKEINAYKPTVEQALDARVLLDMADYDRGPLKNLAFTIPVSAGEFVLSDPMSAQLVADQFKIFEDFYGHSPQDVLMNIGDWTSEQYDRIILPMKELGLDFVEYSDREEFVIRKLEQQLGSQYVVVVTNGALRVCKAIPAELIMPKELLSGSNADSVLKKAYLSYTSNKYGESMPLGELLPFNNFPKVIADKLKKIGLYIDTTASYPYSGYYEGGYTNSIHLNLKSNRNIVKTLVHEINHALQDIFSLPGGINPKFFREPVNMKLLAYVASILPHSASSMGLGFEGLTENEILSEMERMRTDDFLVTWYHQKLDKLCHLAYWATLGEVWARHCLHNEKLIKGFAVDDKTGVVTSPDGKRTFYMHRFTRQGDAAIKAQYSLSSAPVEMTPALAGSALDVAVQRIFELKALEAKGVDVSRPTYHSHLTNRSSTDLTQGIINKDLPIITRYTLRLNDILLNAESYLSPEILALCNGDYSEDNVVYVVKKYVEDNYEGISIDRTAATHEYVWVDDNAFDDLLLPKIREDLNSDGTSLIKKYADKKIPLHEFYSEAQLNKLGINPACYVRISSEISSTETVFDAEKRAGAIFIQVDPRMTNKRLIDELNHEFRHLLQYYNGFETGFTPDFKITSEMLADIKKHLPETFKNKTVLDLAKRISEKTGESVDEIIARRAIYYDVGGEREAYAFRAEFLYGKPVYVTTEAGKPTIFMPWYDPKTGEGRYKTEFLANRKEKSPFEESTTEKEPSEKPKKREALEKREELYEYPSIVKAIPSMKSRFFSWKKAKGTLLENFYKRGKANQMDPDLQNFIIGATGHENELPSELLYAIKKGVLTKQALFKWFREVDKDAVNEFTFDLINKHFFKNTILTSMEELDKFLALEPSNYWAVTRVLRRYKLSNDELLAQNDVDTLIAAINAMPEDSPLRKKIFKEQKEFGKQWFYYKSGKMYTEDVGVPDRVLNYMRVLAMQYFDGSLASAFYVANAFHKYINFYEREVRHKAASLEAKQETSGGDEGLSYEDTLSDESAAILMQIDANDSVGNDIIALYEQGDITSETEMINTLVYARYDRLLKSYSMIHRLRRAYRKRLASKEGIDVNAMSEDQRQFLNKEVKKYVKMLKEKSYDEIAARYAKVFDKDADSVTPIKLDEDQIEAVRRDLERYKEYLLDTDYDNLVRRYNEYQASAITDATADSKIFDTKKYKTDRLSIVNRIKRTSSMLLKMIRDGKITFQQLPKEVQDMYVLTTAKTESGKTVEVYELKPDVYMVGRGRKRIETADTKGHFTYSAKHDITNTEEFKQDVAKILKNDQLLRDVYENAKIAYKEREGKKVSLKYSGKTLSKSIDRSIRMTKTRKQGMSSTEFRVAARNRTSDTPNIFNIVSNVEMPAVLRKIFDTSFDRFADTKVQYASVNEKGELYSKEKFGAKEFKSMLQHEVSNWDAFYEANRETLLSLSREDVLDIVEFIQKGATTFDGPANKLEAFKIFTLAYITEAMTVGYSQWHLTNAEMDVIRQLYERITSVGGTILNAARQIHEVINPFKKVAQRFLSDFDIDPLEFDNLTKAAEAVQRAENKEDRTKAAAELGRIIERVERLMVIGGDETLRTLKKRFDDTKKKLNAARLAGNDAEIARLQEEYKLITERYERMRLAGDFGARKEIRRLLRKVKAFRYTAMLSSPVTWMRNLVSNVALKNLNAASDAIANFAFAKKGYRAGQWNLAKVQVREDVKTFIEEEIRHNTIFDPLYENTNKYYDVRDTKKIDTKRDMLVNMITTAMERKYAAQHRFDTKTFNTIAMFVSKCISDKRFVKYATEKYFGKILTIEVNAGNVTLDKGLSNRILALFTDAVIMANYDYMHKPSFIADALSKIRDSAPLAYEVLTFWQPFVNSSFNWFTEMLKYSPVGLVASIVNMARLEKRIQHLDERRARGETVPGSRALEYLTRRDVGKGVIGLVFSMLGILLGSLGVIRIDKDDEKFYCYAGDVKIDISSIFASSSVLVGASVAQVWTQNDNVSFESVMRNVTGQLFEGFIINDILGRHRFDDGNFWDFALTEADSMLRSFVPQFWQLAMRFTTNKKIKYAPGLKGVWQRYVNSFVPTQPAGARRINVYTGELQTKYALPSVPGEFLKSGLLFGAKIFWSDMTEGEILAKEYGVNKAELTGELTVNGKVYKLDKDVINTKYGQINKEALVKLKSQKHYVELENGSYATLHWNKLNDNQKTRVIDRTMTRDAELAKIYAWTQSGHKYYASDSMYQALKEYGITTNVYRGDKGFVE